MDWEKIFELCLSNERLLSRMQKGHLQVNAKHTDVPIQKKKKKVQMILADTSRKIYKW